MLTTCVEDSLDFEHYRSGGDKSIYHVTLHKAVLTSIIPVLTHGKHSIRQKGRTL